MELMRMVLFWKILMSLSSTTAISSTTKVLTQQQQCSPLRICIIVEPSPLTYVSGYANRFQALLRHLRDVQDTVEMVTTEVVAKDPPATWLNFPVHYAAGIRLPHYPLMSIGTDWKLKAASVIRKMKPDVIHASSPGFMVFGGLLWSRLFSVPLVMSYHTHLPVYVRSYVRPVILSMIAEWLRKSG
jgi:sulfoquinovosyltransferase